MSAASTSDTQLILTRPGAFRPPFWARSGVLQTVLGQAPTRAWGTGVVTRRSHGELIRVSQGVTLQGFYTPALSPPARGLVLMLTGWGGHVDAPYMLSTGKALLKAGYELFRLNHPDHGGTHQLSEALFHFGMVDKTHEAFTRVVSAIRTRPVFLVGFSMGGTFALHVARRGLPGLKGVVTVSPAFDLARSLTALRQGPFHGPFLRQWKQSLLTKAELFPHRYRFEHLAQIDELEAVALEVLQAQGRSLSFEEYTAHYSLPPERMAQLKVPALVMSAADDPITGPLEVERYAHLPRLAVHQQAKGGHVGFVRSLFGPAWYEPFVIAQLSHWASRDEAKANALGLLSGDVAESAASEKARRDDAT